METFLQQLISALFDRWAGKPILVLGGGPSVSTDLPKLIVAPACAISANEHGMKQNRFPVDLLVNMDLNHCLKKAPMEKLLRPYGVPIANRFSWADYRLCDWPLAQNTGLAAVALACALGGNPVIVTGIDMWTGSKRYFYLTGNESPRVRPRSSVHPAMLRRTNKERIAKLRSFCKGANVRPMSGPLTEAFPVFDQAETLPPARDIRYRAEVQKITPVPLLVAHSFRLRGQDMVRPGTTVMLSPKESESLRLNRRLR